MNLNEKVNYIKNIDTYEAQFIVKVINAFQSKNLELKKDMKETTIILKQTTINSTKNIIDLDKIWAKPYFYTKMRVKLEKLINYVQITPLEIIQKKPYKFFKQAIYNNAIAIYEKPENEIDIVEFIKTLNPNAEYIFIAEKLDEETLFKEKQLKYALGVLKIQDIKERYSAIYDIINNYLNKDFISNNYCDFKNDKCIAQRKHKLYPINRKDGCCFRRITKCPNLDNGKCKVECMACRLFACPFLGKMGIGYWANEFVLFKAFFTKKQRQHLIYDFYKPKEYVIEKMYKEY